jgi:hypothetical protein
VQPRTDGGSGSNRHPPADDYQHDRYDRDGDGRRTAGNKYRHDFDLDQHDIDFGHDGIDQHLLTGATLEVQRERATQEEPSMKRTDRTVLTLVLTVSLALFGCSTTRTADTTVTTNTSMASSSSTTEVTIPVATNYGGTAATTGTTATYGTGATTNPIANYGMASTDINTAATTDTTANVSMASSSTSTTSTTSDTSGSTRHRRHRAMHKE